MKNTKQPRGNRYKAWIKQAEFDLAAAQASFDAGFYEWTSFQSEQVVEKALKGVLVYSGFKPPRIHKLAVLVGMANRANRDFKNTHFEFKDLESFTFISRYPFLIPGENLSPHEFIEKKDAVRCINQARVFLKTVINLLEG